MTRERAEPLSPVRVTSPAQLAWTTGFPRGGVCGFPPLAGHQGITGPALQAVHEAQVDGRTAPAIRKDEIQGAHAVTTAPAMSPCIASANPRRVASSDCAHASEVEEITTAPELDALRDDPRFELLLERMGLRNSAPAGR